MTGIAAGIAASVGVAFGWWGAAVVAISAGVMFLVARSGSAMAACAVAVVAALLGAWRAESPLISTTDGARSHSGVARVVSAPVQTGQFQHFVVELEDEDDAQHGLGAFRTCVAGDPY